MEQKVLVNRFVKNSRSIHTKHNTKNNQFLVQKNTNSKLSIEHRFHKKFGATSRKSKTINRNMRNFNNPFNYI